MQAQAALSGQLVVARQQHADICLQLQKDHAALQQAALQEHALQKVIPTCPPQLQHAVALIQGSKRSLSILQMLRLG